MFQGLLGSRPEQFKDPDKMVRLWLHESERVYGDILVSYENMASYAKLAQGVGKKLFANVNIDRFFAKENPDLLIYNHFANGDLQDKLYNEVSDVDSLGKVLNDALNEYNETNAAMPLVLFTDAMKHICRVTRVINNPSAALLLVLAVWVSSRFPALVLISVATPLCRFRLARRTQSTHHRV